MNSRRGRGQPSAPERASSAFRLVMLFPVKTGTLVETTEIKPVLVCIHSENILMM